MTRRGLSRPQAGRMPQKRRLSIERLEPRAVLAAEADVFGNGMSIPDGDATPRAADGTDFGGVAVSGAAKRQTFEIRNPGTAQLGLSGQPLVQISGINAADFRVVTQPSTNRVPTGGVLTFVVEFDPSASGVRTADIVIPNTDADENPFNFRIQGSGTLPSSPEIQVLGNGAVIDDGDTTPRLGDDTDFGSIDVAAGTVMHTFSIQNIGQGVLNLIGSPRVQVTGSHAADFTVVSQPGATVSANGGIQTFSVRFDPGASGIRSATLSIANNDNNEDPYDFLIRGTGLVADPDIEVRGNGVVIVADDSSPTTSDGTDFGSADVGSTGLTERFIIINTGSAPLALTGGLSRVQVLGAHANDFSVVGSQPASPIQPGQSVAFDVRFSPNGAGSRTATLSIPNNDPNENPYQFSIRGSGTVPFVSGPRVTSFGPPIEDLDAGIIDHVVVRFDKSVEESSFTTSDITLFRGDTSIPITSIERLTNISYSIHISVQTTPGTYIGTIGPFITDTSGNPMNQDGDTTNGENPADRFDGSFVLEAPFVAGPRVTSYGPPLTDLQAGRIDHIVVRFDKAVDESTFAVSDTTLQRDGVAVPIESVERLTNLSYRINIPVQATSGTFLGTVGPFIADTSGNPMNQDGDTTNGENPADRFEASFVLNAADDQIAEANDLGGIGPSMNVTRNASIGDGAYGANDTDFYSFVLAASAQVTIAVDTPTSTLDAYLRLFNATGVQIVANDNRAGDNVDPRLVVSLGPGTYYVGVSGVPNRSYDPNVAGSSVASATTGEYTFTISVPIGGTQSIAPELPTQQQVKQLVQPSFNGNGNDLEIVIAGAVLNQTIEILVSANGGTVLLGTFTNVAGDALWHIAVDLTNAGLAFANAVTVISDTAVSIVNAEVRYVTAAIAEGYEAIAATAHAIPEFIAASYEFIADLFLWSWTNHAFLPMGDLASANLDWTNKQTIILTHGWNDRLDLGQADEFMEKFAIDFERGGAGRIDTELEAYQILAVDWWDGGSAFGSDPDGDSSDVGNLRIADAIQSSFNGIAAAKPLARKLIDDGIDPSKVMLIGHSNGAGFMASMALELNEATGRQVAELVSLDAPYLTASYWEVQRAAQAVDWLSNFYMPSSQLDLPDFSDSSFDVLSYIGDPPGYLDLQAGFGFPIFFGGNVTNLELDSGISGMRFPDELAHSQVPLRYAMTAHQGGYGPAWGFQASSFVNPAGPLQQNWIWREAVVPGAMVPLPNPVALTSTAFQSLINGVRSVGAAIGTAAVSVWDDGVQIADNLLKWGKGINSSLVRSLAGPRSLNHLFFDAHSPAVATMEVKVPDDAVLLGFDLTVTNPGNSDVLQVALGDQVIGQANLADFQWGNARRVEFWVNNFAAQTTNLSFYMPSDIPSDAEFLVSNIDFTQLPGANSAPVVTDILVSSTAWFPAFLTALKAAGLGDGGYSILAAPAGPLPWQDVDQIRVKFDKNTVVDEDNLTLFGVNLSEYTINGFSYDPVTFTATWTFSQPFRADKFWAALDTSSIDPVRDVLGHVLGGATQFRVDIAPGDVDGNGGVNFGDYLQTRAKVGQVAGTAGYHPRFDVDGNGGINFGDALLTRALVGSVLPPGQPTVPAQVMSLESMESVGRDPTVAIANIPTNLSLLRDETVSAQPIKRTEDTATAKAAVSPATSMVSSPPAVNATPSRHEVNNDRTRAVAQGSLVFLQGQEPAIASKPFHDPSANADGGLLGSVVNPRRSEYHPPSASAPSIATRGESSAFTWRALVGRLFGHDQELATDDPEWEDFDFAHNQSRVREFLLRRRSR